MSTTRIAQGGASLSGVAVDHKGVVHVCDSQTGSISKVENGHFSEILNTHGQPAAIAFDPTTDAMHICDLAHQSVLRVEGHNAETDTPVLSEIVREYNRKPLHGPTALAFDHEGTVYFTDSGPFGENTIDRPLGSVFSIAHEQSLVHPLALNCLAHSSGICISPNQQCVYVCEMMQNRVLRFAQRPKGAFHMSVFHSFNGAIGPSACTCDDSGNLYVSQFDFRTNAHSGIVSILQPSGQLQSEITVPGPEITGLFYHSANKLLYITEASQNSLYTYTTTTI
jgi:aspartate beta-hydroxylase